MHGLVGRRAKKIVVHHQDTQVPGRRRRKRLRGKVELPVGEAAVDDRRMRGRGVEGDEADTATRCLAGGQAGPFGVGRRVGIAGTADIEDRIEPVAHMSPILAIRRE